MVTCWSGMEGNIIRAAGEAQVDGLIVDALGCGNVPPKCKAEMMKLGEAGLPMVLTTRVLQAASWRNTATMAALSP